MCSAASDMPYDAVATPAWIIGAVMLLLTLHLLLLRAWLLLRASRRRRCLARWEPLLLHAIEGHEPALPRLGKADVLTLLATWNHLQASVLGEAKERLNAVAGRMGLPAVAGRLLRQGSLRERLIAITALGHLRERSAWDLLCMHATDTQVVLSLAAARALVEIDRRAAAEQLLPLIVLRRDWPSGRVAGLLLALGPDLVSQPLGCAAAAAAGQDAVRLIRYLEVIQTDAAAAAVRAIMERADDVDILGACLRQLRDPEDLPAIRRLLDHPRWEVRVQAAAAVGRIGGPDDVPALRRLLADAEWWVRYRAAHGLCALLADAPGRLDHIQATHLNPFARDVLAQARAERSIA